MGEVLLLIVSFGVVLAGALVFTNAVEWAGHQLAMGQGAVGSLLAAVGTAMPETLIPIVAIVGGGTGSEDVALGAIIGAPFLLATIAMALIGMAALGYRSRRPQDDKLEADAGTLERDLVFFSGWFLAAMLLGLGIPEGLRIPVAVVFLIGYGVYVRLTLASAGSVESAEEIGPLIMSRGVPGSDPEEPSGRMVALQFAVGLAAIVGGAHLFVEELVAVAESLGVETLVLALVLAPLATELPEKANSFFWVRDGKDSLALGNVTGAMVFQSTVPVAFGLAFTAWDLESYALLSGLLGLLGGAVAYASLHRGRRFTRPAIAAWALLYAVFPVYVVLS